MLGRNERVPGVATGRLTVSSAATELRGEIHAFFERYRDAFNALDGEAVAKLFVVPSGIGSETGYTHWPSFEAIRENMVGLCRRYREQGYRRATFVPMAVERPGERSVVVELRWRIERHDGESPWVFNTRYDLTRTLAGWRVRLVTLYDEKPPTSG